MGRIRLLEVLGFWEGGGRCGVGFYGGSFLILSRELDWAVVGFYGIVMTERR